MRVNIYAEEMTDRIELVTKEIEGREFHAVRFYLDLPVTMPDGRCVRGPFMHYPGDDDSAAVTFWGKRDLRPALLKALAVLDDWNASRGRPRILTEEQYQIATAEPVVDAEHGA